MTERHVSECDEEDPSPPRDQRFRVRVEREEIAKDGSTSRKSSSNLAQGTPRASVSNARDASTPTYSMG